MPSQDDLINANREAMQRRAEARARGEVPGRSVPLSRSQANRRIRQLEAEINRLREVPTAVEQLQSELTSVRSAHASLVIERDALAEAHKQASESLQIALNERDKARGDLDAARKAFVPSNG